MGKIVIEKINRLTGVDTHDQLRDGVSNDLDPIKVSAVINALVMQVNLFGEQIETMKAEIFRTQKSNRTIKRKIKKL